MAHLVQRAIKKAQSQAKYIFTQWLDDTARKLRLSLPIIVTPLRFPLCDSPEVTIVIPAGLRRIELYRCLFEIASKSSKSSIEVLVIARQCPSSVEEFLRHCSGIRIVHSAPSENMSDVLNCATKIARGTYLYFLDRGLVTEDSVAVLVDSFRSNVAAVGSQVRRQDGRIMRRDTINGTVSVDRWGPGASFVRDLEPGETAGVMVRLRSLEEVGGFRPCDNLPEGLSQLIQDLRGDGYNVLYQPRSVVFEQGHSSVNEWVGEPKSEKKTILVVDEYVPFFDRSAGGRRMLAILKLMRDLKYRVVFLANEGGAYEPYTSLLRGIGVDVRFTWAGKDGVRAMHAAGNKIDIAWLSRPQVCAKYLPIMRAQTEAFIIYDTVDLHHRRLGNERAGSRFRDQQRLLALEIYLARNCDRTVVTTGHEREILASRGIERTFVIPVIEELEQRVIPGFEARTGILFLGNYTHKPNEDAAQWLCEVIYPLVRARIPKMTVTLAGAEPTRAVISLASQTISVPGYIRDLRRVFDDHRVFVAPLRHGAGVKGKIVEAMANGIPIVTTSVGAEGTGVEHGRSGFISDDATEFAEEIIRLYEDADVWACLAANATRVAERFTPESVKPGLEAALDV